MFSEKESAYINAQRLARIATVSEEGKPDVAPVSFEFDSQHFYVGGRAMKKTLKYKNVQVNDKVALVIDDVESVDPWKPRGVKIHGWAELVEREGRFGSGSYIRISPQNYWSWGVEGPVFVNGKPVIKRGKF